MVEIKILSIDCCGDPFPDGGLVIVGGQWDQTHAKELLVKHGWMHGGDQIGELKTCYARQYKTEELNKSTSANVLLIQLKLILESINQVKYKQHMWKILKVRR